MILRRFSQALKDQNWAAITIEFVLLVLGVFLGIQVANWNEARIGRDRERVFLGQLRDEIGENARSVQHQLDFQKEVVASGRRALAFLQTDGHCAEGCAGLVIDFFHASQLWGAPYARVRYEENQRMGFPADQATRRSIDDFYAFIDGWDVVTGTSPAYRERVRGHLTPEVSDVLWRDCAAVTVRYEILVRGCEAALAKLDLQPILRALHADAELQSGLNFWIGQNLNSLNALPQALQHARTASAAIAANLGSP
jgi:hypothetical protein